MEVSSSNDGQVQVVTCQGRLTMTTARTLRDAVERAVAEQPPRVVVDLAGVTFVDSSGLGALIAGLKRARQAGGDLRIAGAGEQVTMVLQLTNLDKVLKPYPDLESARDRW